MKRNNHKNSIISNFVRENCSPVKHERKFAQDEFYFLNKILIGSIQVHYLKLERVNVIDLLSYDKCITEKKA